MACALTISVCKLFQICLGYSVGNDTQFVDSPLPPRQKKQKQTTPIQIVLGTL